MEENGFERLVENRIFSKLYFSKNISFEWSLRIKKDSLEQREKFTCWINNDNNVAQKELEILIELLNENESYAFLDEIPQEAILNFGLGISNKSIQSIYVHYLDGENLKDRYLAFSNGGIFEYEFYYLPITPKEESPSSFIHQSLLGVYDELIKNPRLNSMSGFWIRRNKDNVDQLDLAYPWQPPLEDLLEKIYSFCNKDVRLALKEYGDHYMRHIAFNKLETPSITIYFSSKTERFPKSYEELKTLTKEYAKIQNELIEKTFFKGISFTSIKKNYQLDNFYSTNNLGIWQKALGENMHYHFGLFNKQDNLEDIFNEEPFVRAVEELTKFISPKSSVYDMGCGWGGVSKYLIKEKKCRVVGITISKTQYKYCDSIGIRCRYGDMENTLPPGYFDNLLLFESLEHVKDKYAFLRKLRNFGGKLIIRTSTQESEVNNIVFGGSMVLISSDKLEKILKETGWKVIHKQNRRDEAMATIDIWNARMDQIPKQDDFHFELWRTYCKKVKQYKDEWAKANLLIDLVAE